MTIASHKIGFRSRRRSEAEIAPPAAEPTQRAVLPRFAVVADGGVERSNDDIVAELAQVAEEHAPDAGYGETAWNASTGTVFWQCADWTSNEEMDAAEAAFRAVEGVLEYESAAEGGLPYDYEARMPDEGWEIVWPSSMTAAAPPPAALAPEPPDAPSGLLKTAMDALLALAAKPAAPVPDVHVHVGSPDLSVKVEPPQTHVHMPEQPAPEVNLSVEAPPAPPAPEVHVTVEAAPAPDVHVDVAAPPPADVHVDVAAPPPANIHVEVPRPGPIRVETLEDGGRVYIPEPAE